MKLEVVVLPVADVDRAEDSYAKDFYKALGWRLHADFATGGSMSATYESAADLAQALRRAAAAHGIHEQEIGQADPYCPDWYAQYVVQEQAGRPSHATTGAGT